MGEGILIYGLGNSKRRYTRDLQSFAEHVLSNRRTNNSLYIFGPASKAILSDLVHQGVHLKTEMVAVSDKTIVKYKEHPKREKGAVVSFHRFRMVESAVKKPKNVYIDSKRSRLIYVASVKYSKGKGKDKVLKVVVEPNQKMGKNYYHKVVSIGVVDRNNMNTSQYKKIK